MANNTYLANYDTIAISNFIMYLDANNLYGLAMSAKLPYNKFEWNTSVHENDILSSDEESRLRISKGST